ncbi:MAG: amidase [Alphaproteobacteria bacterium]|nr:amidase [Alphaproteobacteria bacterium]
MTALELGAGIGGGTIDPVDLAEHFLSRIETLDREHSVYLRATPERARAEAVAARGRARRKLRVSPLDGVPISWKDLFDSAGTATTAGSPLLVDRVPRRDAVALERATRAGLVCLGKTTMTELAYSGLGVNPSMGTPRNAHDPNTPRAPGGSSSGAAASVAFGLAAAGIGSDTGGSVRVPAGWQGLVGLKTTYGVIPIEGSVPLWPDVDTVGPLARTVGDTNAIFAVLDGGKPADLGGANVKGFPVLVPTNYVWDDIEPAVKDTVDAAIDRLAAVGAKVSRKQLESLDDLAALGAAPAQLMSSEAYAVWRDALEANPDRVYKPILDRFRIGKSQNAADMIAIRHRLKVIAKRYLAETAAFAAVLMPTSPILPPPLEDLWSGGETYLAKNMLSLRNTRIANVLSLCAITLPCGRVRSLPVGLMLVAHPFTERALLRLADAAENELKTMI